MSIPRKLETYFLNDKCIEIYVPEERAIQQLYRNNKQDAYWAKVWPASVGLCLFLEQYTHLIRDKKILELAAGLGLVGLYTAQHAKEVTITDIEPQAASFVRQSALHLQLKNIITQTLNWKDATQMADPDVVLLSDVNYAPSMFDELQQVIENFLQKNIRVIISTPQRLAARVFMTRLLKHSSLQWNTIVAGDGVENEISVFVLGH